MRTCYIRSVLGFWCVYWTQIFWRLHVVWQPHPKYYQTLPVHFACETKGMMGVPPADPNCHQRAGNGNCLGRSIGAGQTTEALRLLESYMGLCEQDIRIDPRITSEEREGVTPGVLPGRRSSMHGAIRLVPVLHICKWFHKGQLYYAA